eukprot:8979420-Prorocentrum_lima.AAC.1
MTSSLVGSEMCIRDSWKGYVIKLGSDMDPRLDGPGLGGRRATLGRHEAVSYTHLTLPTICSV